MKIAVCVLAVGVVFATATVPAQTTAQRVAVPLEPVTAVLDAARTHDVVALGLGRHNNLQGHAFLMRLLQNPRLPDVVTDVVIECGNARYQGMADDFVLAGRAVPTDTLRAAWQDTTQPHSGCDTGLAEEIYRTLRRINASLDAGRRVRLLLGDPPINWDSPTRKQDRMKFMEARDSHPAEVIRQEVLGKKRRALIVYGQMHLQRKQLLSNYDMSHPLAQTIVSLLETAGARVFSVWGNTHADISSLQADIASWPTPSLAMTKGTVLGAADFAVYYPFAAGRVALRNGKPVPAPREEWRELPMESQFDAVLHLGAPSSITVVPIPAALCRDAAYMKMRRERLTEAGPQVELKTLIEQCAKVTGK
jgi:hypothetical protein